MASHLSVEERDRIAQLRHLGTDLEDIARDLSRSPSTICRELKRNAKGGQYYAAQAQREAERRRRERPISRRMDDPEVNGRRNGDILVFLQVSRMLRCGPAPLRRWRSCVQCRPARTASDVSRLASPWSEPIQPSGDTSCSTIRIGASRSWG